MSASFAKRALHLLVAEDDEDDRFFIERAFKKGGAGRLNFVGNGEEVIDYLSGAGKFSDRRQFPYPDLVLLDVRMPRLDGFSVLKWVRNQEAYHTLPVIMWTSSDDKRDVARASEFGANSFLEKPFSVDELVTMVQAMCSFWSHNQFPSSFAQPP